LNFLLLLLLLPFVFCVPVQAQSYKYIRIGQKNDIRTHPSAGIAMMGGGDDLDEAFRWLCHKADGGDFLILRSHGDDAYNSYVNGLCRLNSAATLIISNRNGAVDPSVATIIRHSAAIFIAGGDQAEYVNFWKSTPVQDAINDAVARGTPIGATSAGLAILGESSYGALNDPRDDSELQSKDALQNPYFSRVTLVRNFLSIPILRGTITDSHFAKRDRMGRMLVFLARLIKDGWSETPREVAVDERSAVLVEPSGDVTVVGSGRGAYFLRPTQAPARCESSKPLTFRDVTVYKAPSGAHFNLSTWDGKGGTGYTLSVDRGVIRSSQSDRSVY
jgi:cyanophycinase